jgi:hypothetical protein
MVRSHSHVFPWYEGQGTTQNLGRYGAALATAINLYRAIAMTFWLPQAEAALAQVEEQ